MLLTPIVRNRRAILCVSSVALCLAGEPPARAQMAFEHVVVDASGPQDLWGKTFGDLNHDGLPDIITGGRSSGGLVWYENPSWTKRTIAASGRFSTDHEVCDVDRDGLNDVVSIEGSSLFWYESPDWTRHPIGSDTLHDIEVFDFEGDGDCDVVGRNQGSFSGSGATLYFYVQTTPTSWVASQRSVPDGEGLVATDLDGDEDLDLVVNEVWIENRGAEIASWSQHTYTSEWTHGAAYVNVADVDRDGNQDIVLAPSERARDSYRIAWFEAPDDPTEAEWPEHVVDPEVEAVHHFVGAADFDRDGDIDIATAEMEQGDDPDEVKIYLQDSGAWTKEVISGAGSHSMRIVDIDLDGDMDLFGANHASHQVDLWINRTPPNRLGLDAWQRRPIDTNRPGRAIFIASDDLDGDGHRDVATGAYWYRNPGDPAGAWQRSAFGSPLNNVALLHDMDGDGDVDALGTEGSGAENAPDFVWGRNDGAGSFTILENVDSGSGDFLQGVVVARFAPGEPERVALSWHARSDGVEALVIPEAAAVDPWPLESLSATTQQEALSHGDVDRDGDEDLLLGTLWLRNDGSQFSAHTLFDTSDLPDRNRLADIDRDGRLDAVVGYEAISTTGKLAWYAQPKIATDPWSEHPIAEITGPMSLDVADMDGDGDLDVVAGEHDLSNPETAGLWVFENEDGAGSSWLAHEVHIGDEHHDGAQLVDIDRDGDLDILSIGWGHDRVLLYENLAVPEPGPERLFAAALLALAALRAARRMRGPSHPSLGHLSE